LYFHSQLRALGVAFLRQWDEVVQELATKLAAMWTTSHHTQPDRLRDPRCRVKWVDWAKECVHCLKVNASTALRFRLIAYFTGVTLGWAWFPEENLRRQPEQVPFASSISNHQYQKHWWYTDSNTLHATFHTNSLINESHYKWLCSPNIRSHLFQRFRYAQMWHDNFLSIRQIMASCCINNWSYRWVGWKIYVPFRHNKKLCYCRATMQQAMLVNLCYASRGIGVRKVLNSKSDIQGHSRFPIGVSLQQ